MWIKDLIISGKVVTEHEILPREIVQNVPKTIGEFFSSSGDFMDKMFTLVMLTDIKFFLSLSQENKYKEAVGFYEPIVKKHYDNVSVPYKRPQVLFMGNFVKGGPQHYIPLLTNRGAGQKCCLVT